MKIVKEGKKLEAWVGKKLTCIDCDCKFVLEVGDKVKWDVEGSYYTVKCPHCKAEINFRSNSSMLVCCFGIDAPEEM